MTTWTVFRAGGLDQIRPSSGADLQKLGEIDRKLWVALSCPAAGLEFDTRTLTLLDGDQDGRVRVEEVVTAAQWAAVRLRDPGLLLRGASSLDLNAFADTPEGMSLQAAARQVLVNLGLAGQTSISVEHTADTARIFAKSAFNGDGVVTVHQTTDAEVQSLLDEVIRCCGAAKDRSGEPGVDRPGLDRCVNALRAYAAWWDAGAAAAAGGNSAVLPLGEATPAAYAALKAVRSKIGDWFARCRLAAFDPRAAEPLNRDAAAYAAIANCDLSALGEDIQALPLRRVEAGAALDLGTGINPAWSMRIAHFRDLVVTPQLGAGTSALDEKTFQELVARFSAYAAWTAGKQGAEVEPLGIPRIRAILAGDLISRTEALIAQDGGVAGDLAALEDLDRLLRYVRDLGRLLRNFLHFGDFYAREAPAIFQAGTLYLDSRSTELCVRVADVAAHATLASASRLCLVYCECSRPGAKFTIAAAMTQGDADYLTVGRRGIFYDRQGKDHDAVVVRLVDNPISIRQAFWTPYKKFARLIEEQIEKLAAAKDKAVMDQAAAKAQAIPAAAPAAATDPKKPPFDIARFAGIFAAIGLALGALGAAVAAIFGAFIELVWWQQLLVIPGVVLAISLPSMVMAALKLRQRTLGPLLEGSGWAINGRVKITFSLGRALTRMKKLPAGSQRVGGDPYADGSSRRRLLVVVFVLAVAGGAAGWWWWTHKTAQQATAAPSPEGATSAPAPTMPTTP